MCTLEVTLRKHITTKHAAMKIKCVLCDYKFSTNKACKDHIAYHLEEIRLMEPKYLLNGQEKFKCKICDFISKSANADKIHWFEQVNQHLPPDAGDGDNESEKIQQDKLEKENWKKSLRI